MDLVNRELFAKLFPYIGKEYFSEYTKSYRYTENVFGINFPRQ